MINQKDFKKLQNEVNIASIELIRDFCFYGHILVQLPKIYLTEDNELSKDIKTFAVGKESSMAKLIKLYVNMNFLQEIFKNNTVNIASLHLIETLKHEILHIVFNHLSIELPDKTRSAVAADLAVNSFCNKDNFITITDPKTHMTYSSVLFPEDYGLEPKKSFMWYYNNLLKNEKFKKQCSNGSFGIGGIFSDAVKSHELWKKVMQDPLAKDFIRDLIRKARNTSKENNTFGNIPGEIIEQLDDLCGYRQAIVPWQSVFKMFVANAVENILSYTIKRRSRRFHSRPGTKKEDLLNLAIGIDSSGSVSIEQLNMVFNELYWIHKAGAKITIFECDTQITREPYSFEKFDKKVMGRGGTDLEPVLKRVSEERYDALIYFTDFDAPVISKKYNIPVLWILSNCNMEKEQYPYKYGTFLRIKNDNTIEAIR